MAILAGHVTLVNGRAFSRLRRGAVVLASRRLSAMLEHGAMPDRPVMAEEMTDTNCEPDAEMISRCRNVVRLADGRGSSFGTPTT